MIRKRRLDVDILSVLQKISYSGVYPSIQGVYKLTIAGNLFIKLVCFYGMWLHSFH